MADDKPEEPTDEHGKRVVRDKWFHGNAKHVDDHEDGHAKIDGLWGNYIEEVTTHVNNLSNVFVVGARCDNATTALQMLIREADGHREVAAERAKRCAQLAEAYREGKWKMDSVVAISRAERLAALRASHGYEADAAEDEALRLAQQAVDMVVDEVVEHPAHMAEGDTFGIFFGEHHAPAGTDHNIELERPVADSAQPERTIVPAAAEPDPFKHHAEVWPQQSGHASAATEAMSAPGSVEQHHGQDAHTDAQSAESGGDSTTIDVEYTDTNTQAAAAMTAMNTSFGPTETEHRARHVERGYQKDFGEHDDAPPASDWLSVLKALTQLLSIVAKRGTSYLAPGAPLEFAIAVYEDWQGRIEWQFFTNAGYGVVPPGAHVPAQCELGFEAGIGWTINLPRGGRSSTPQAVIGVQSAAEIALRDYQYRQARETALGLPYLLHGIATTGSIPADVRGWIIEYAGRTLGAIPPEPELIEGELIKDEHVNADRNLLRLDHPLYLVAEPLAARLDKAQQNMDWHQQIGLAVKLVDDICVAAETASQPSIAAAFSAFANWQHVNRHALDSEFSPYLPVLWDAVNREIPKPIPERRVWEIVKAYKAVVSQWALNTLLDEYERGWNHAVGNPWWLHTIAYLHVKAHDGMIESLARQIPVFPDHPDWRAQRWTG